ncbi:hypothetical protein [Paenibacillus polymyxa]|uniref:hypothetical protein n=1 Tax=Paenibacillus polymyxa TaxID=1406 RepID=UPI0006948A6B|nr:hypothetical protein [Paenibacillus polymyxa]
MTGDGRRNITNDSTVVDTDNEAVALSRKYYSSQAEFTLPVLQQFGIGLSFMCSGCRLLN